MHCSIIIYYLLGFYPYQFSIYPHLLGKKKDNRYETQWGPSTFLNIYIETQWSLSLLKLFNIKNTNNHKKPDHFLNLGGKLIFFIFFQKKKIEKLIYDHFLKIRTIHNIS